MRWSEEDYDNYMKLKGKDKMVKKSTKSKYNNKKTTIDGITFDSKREAEYYCQLKLLEKAKVIKILELQPRFELQPTFKKNGVTHRSIVYVADFKILNEHNEIEIIDVKGMKTDLFKAKQKMFEYKYPEYHLKLVK